MTNVQLINPIIQKSKLYDKLETNLFNVSMLNFDISLFNINSLNSNVIDEVYDKVISPSQK